MNCKDYNPSPVDTAQDFASSTAEYANLQVDSIKLAATESISTLLSTTFGVMLAVLMFAQALLFLAIALMFSLGAVIGYGLSAVVIAGVFTALGLVIYLLRRRLILSPLIRTFIRVFFNRSPLNQRDDE